MKRFVIFLSIFFLGLFSANAQSYSGGSGTYSDPYKMATAADLIDLSNNSSDWNKYFIQTADIAFNSDETQVDWDGDGSATWDTEDQKGFKPIGNITIKFTGEYNGDGHVIDYLYASFSSDEGGLFGYTTKSTIKNLGVTNAEISSSNNEIGILVGFHYDASSIQNCYTTGSVNGNEEVGGLVGENIYKSAISNSYSMASVTGTSSVGGLAGKNNGTNTFFFNCFTAGSVNGANEVGGLVGIQSSGATTTNSFWDITTSGQSSSAGGTGKTTTEMKDFDTFTDETTTGLAIAWDFVTNPNDDTGNNDYWDMDQYETVNNGYPILSWQVGADNSLTPFSGGDGTSGNPYQISTTADLINLSKASMVL